MTDPTSFTAMLEQLRALDARRNAARKTRMPTRPAGEIRSGSATEAVLAYLLTVPGFRTEAQIRFATGRSHAAVSWALLFLKGRGLVKAVPDVARNPRYHRYAAVRDEGGKNGAI